jgi:SNF2 family DNA or RNA helicase
VKGATTNPPQPVECPDGFVGRLRHYQAEAAGWPAFLDRAGLGGCLAMDMGLGETPTGKQTVALVAQLDRTWQRHSR